MAKRYGSAAAFKAALDAQLRKRSADLGMPLQTVQLKFVMERLLARLFRAPGPPWLLKGGFAMDLRFRPKARTTKDVDLSVSLAAVGAEPDFAGAIRDRLQAATAVDLGDWLAFRIGVPRRELTNAPGGGARYPCEAVLAGNVFARFHVDVAAGDPLVGEPERLVGDDLLAFAGIGPAAVLAIPAAQQFAEKVHAYT
jgi:Nucleotidyl transferase AbiEii toxin, Type IV TA system